MTARMHPRRRRRLAGAAGVVGLVVVGGAVGVPQAAGTERYSAAPESTAGKVRGAGPRDVGLTDRVLTVRVSEVLAQRPGSRLAVGDTVPVLEGSWRDGQGVVVNEVTWAPRGAVGIFFLHRVRGEDLFRHNTSYGRLLYGAPGGQDGPSGRHVETEGPWRDVPPEELATLPAASAYVERLFG